MAEVTRAADRALVLRMRSEADEVATAIPFARRSIAGSGVAVTAAHAVGRSRSVELIGMATVHGGLLEPLDVKAEVIAVDEVRDIAVLSFDYDMVGQLDLDPTTYRSASQTTNCRKCEHRVALVGYVSGLDSPSIVRGLWWSHKTRRRESPDSWVSWVSARPGHSGGPAFVEFKRGCEFVGLVSELHPTKNEIPLPGFEAGTGSLVTIIKAEALARIMDLVGGPTCRPILVRP